MISLKNPLLVWDWTLVRFMWMSVHREKVSKGKQGFIERVFACFGRDLSRRLQLLYLSDAGKSCQVKWRHNCGFVKDHGNLLLCKEVGLPCLKNVQIVCFVTYRNNVPSYCCQQNAVFVTIAIKWSNFFLSRKGKALCERPFTLHRQQPEKCKDFVDVSPPGKISADAHWKRA